MRLGKDLNIKYQTDKPVLTPEEIVNAGFIYVPFPTFKLDINNNVFPHDSPIDGKLYMVRTSRSACRFGHDWPDKEEIKADFIHRLKCEEKHLNAKIAIHSVFLRQYADELDYDLHEQLCIDNNLPYVAPERYMNIIMSRYARIKL